MERAKEWLRLYLETESGRNDAEAWQNLSRLCRDTGDVTGELHALVAICDLPGVEFAEVSSVANRVNEALSEERQSVDFEVRQVLSSRIAPVMEARITEGTATDRSRLAWLYVRLDQLDKAKEHILSGLKMEPGNPYCQKLARRLNLEM
jgi:predicted Zn-dependent protease